MINSNLVEEIPKQKETLAKLKGATMSEDNNEKTKLSDIEDGDKIEQLIKLLPFILELEKQKNTLLDDTPPVESIVSSATLED